MAKKVGLGGAIETPFLTCLIFIQFEANLAQTLNSFVKFVNKNFENMLALLLMSSSSATHIKQSVRIHANGDSNKVINKCEISHTWCKTRY